MFLQNAFYADGGADEVEAADRRAAAPFEQFDAGAERSARGQHRVEDDGPAVGYVFCQLDIVFYGLQRFFVAEEAHNGNLGSGDHADDAVHKAEPGAQDGDDSEHFAGNAFKRHGTGPALGLVFFSGEVPAGFVNQESADVVGDGPEGAAGRVVLSEDAELMADERMVNDVKWHNVPSFGCSVTVRLRTRNVLLWVAQSRPDRKSDFPHRFFFFAGETSCAVFPAVMAASFLLVKAVGSASRGFSGHGCFG